MRLTAASDGTERATAAVANSATPPCITRRRSRIVDSTDSSVIGLSPPLHLGCPRLIYPRGRSAAASRRSRAEAGAVTWNAGPCHCVFSGESRCRRPGGGGGNAPVPAPRPTGSIVGAGRLAVSIGDRLSTYHLLI